MPETPKLSDAPSRVTSVAGQPCPYCRRGPEHHELYTVCDVQAALDARKAATQTLGEVLPQLDGTDRLRALTYCLAAADISVTELAKLAGISRARLYQLLDND